MLFRACGCFLPVLIVLVASGPSSRLVDDDSALFQSRVAIPDQDPDEMDMITAEAGFGPGRDDMKLAEADLSPGADEYQDQEEDEEDSGKDDLKDEAAVSNNFTLGSSVFVGGLRGTIVWDGRPLHEYVKIKWQEGKDTGKTSGIIPVDDVTMLRPADNVTYIGSGRHMKKRVTAADATVKKKTPKVKDTSRRRRSLLRRIVYGVKKMPMVVQIPFKGLKTGVDTITSEMSQHTGIGFNRSIADILKIGQGSLSENATMPQLVRKRVNLTELVRNKTYSAVMKFKDQHLTGILDSFQTEVRMSGEPTAVPTVNEPTARRPMLAQPSVTEPLAAQAVMARATAAQPTAAEAVAAKPARPGDRGMAPLRTCTACGDTASSPRGGRMN